MNADGALQHYFTETHATVKSTIRLSKVRYVEK